MWRGTSQTYIYQLPTKPIFMYHVEEEFERYVKGFGGRIVSSNNPSLVIKKERSSFGITQEEMAGLMGLRRETISRIENGVINPTLDFVIRFSRNMGATKVVRQLMAHSELSGEDAFNPNVLRLCFNMPRDHLEKISELGIKGYEKSRKKALKNLD